MPEHLRVLEPADGDVHDPRGRLHAPLRVLLGEEGQARRRSIADEPENVAKAAETMGLGYAVVTSVDRDDLPDGGAAHFARTIGAIRARFPHCRVEVLIPDFGGRRDLLDVVLDARPDVLAHNLETVKALYRRVRPIAVYERSLDIIRAAAEHSAARTGSTSARSAASCSGSARRPTRFSTRSATSRHTGCDIVTIGQYLSPKRNSLPVEKFYTPAEFAFFREKALEFGIKHAESAPLVRSSYHAHRAHAETQKTNGIADIRLCARCKGRLRALRGSERGSSARRARMRPQAGKPSEVERRARNDPPALTRHMPQLSRSSRKGLDRLSIPIVVSGP